MGYLGVVRAVKFEKVKVPSSRIQRIDGWITPALLAVFACLYLADRSLYLTVLSEDHIVEWATLFCLVLAGVLSLGLARRGKAARGTYPWFFIAFGLFCLFLALEEINWGQRIVRVESPGLFERYSDDQISLHNLLQGVTGLKTKHIAGIGLLGYGACLHFLTRFSRPVARGVSATGLVLPAFRLVPSFAIGTLMMLDDPTGEEEELGELFFSICFLLFMATECVSRFKRSSSSL